MIDLPTQTVPIVGVVSARRASSAPPPGCGCSASTRGPRIGPPARPTLATNLLRHGFQASARHLQPDARGAPETLLAAAGEHSALVVMGTYGHSRLREWIFGGFTQHMLRGAKVPVLMMHRGSAAL